MSEPEECPHCLANFAKELVEIKTSNPPKCGRCDLPLWWDDRSGVLPDREYPSAVALRNTKITLRAAQAALIREGMERDAALRELEALKKAYAEDAEHLRAVVNQLEQIVRIAEKKR